VQALSERLFLGGRGFAIACSVGPGGSDGGEKRGGEWGRGRIGMCGMRGNSEMRQAARPCSDSQQQQQQQQQQQGARL